MKESQNDQLLTSEHEDAQLSVDVVPIRTETVISQYPLHRLSKGKETFSLSITKTNERGKVKTTWDVSPNPKYGEPGILAYKIDTIVINRIIDELRPDIPEIVKIGSLSDIGEEVGRKGTRNTTAIADALSQNAGTLITAKIEYAGNDGRSRTLELRSTRYGVIFVGDRLPNGQKADAVYITLNPSFRDVLIHARTRPLDYDYLRSLPPASQRLYELISRQIFASINYDNPRAKYLYSDLCKFAPLTRYDEWEQVKKQLYKIHLPHKASGYVKAIEYEMTTDSDGRVDWIIWYTPGRKARSEYKAFNKKKAIAETSEKGMSLLEAGKQQDNTASRQESLLASQQGNLLESKQALTESERELVSQLAAHGITERIALELIEKHKEAVERELDAFAVRDQAKIKNPAAWLIKAIQSGDYAPPKKLEAKQKQKQAEDLKKRREETREKFQREYNAYLKAELAKLKKSDTATFAEFEKDFVEMLKLSKIKISESKNEMMKLHFFGEFVNRNAWLSILTFEAWLAAHHPEVVAK